MVPLHTIADEKVRKILEHFIQNYQHNTKSTDQANRILNQLVSLITQQLLQPYPFPIFHEAERDPYDYYQFGIDFIIPLINPDCSDLYGKEVLLEIVENIRRGENVILLANHQTEADPQVLSYFLDSFLKDEPLFAQNMIFIAGHRVTTDPVAVPFSRGRRLLSIYSKRHLDFSPEEKADKILHNQKAIAALKDKLSLGGTCLFIAPSGGRDRADSNGKVLPALFSNESVGLMHLLAEQASRSGKKTTIYPLVLHTHTILPPPPSIEREIGEMRIARYGPVNVQFLPEERILSAEDYLKIYPSGNSISPKELKEFILTEFSERVWQRIYTAYEKISSQHKNNFN
jgi:glycerol-3-phosphate O-acyltransferase